MILNFILHVSNAFTKSLEEILPLGLESIKVVPNKSGVAYHMLETGRDINISNLKLNRENPLVKKSIRFHRDRRKYT